MFTEDNKFCSGDRLQGIQLLYQLVGRWTAGAAFGCDNSTRVGLAFCHRLARVLCEHSHR